MVTTLAPNGLLENVSDLQAPKRGDNRALDGNKAQDGLTGVTIFIVKKPSQRH
ncbi:hypothetical protein MTBLM1_20449 [Rhodospirillaceae bacterium LM-1]|nr:hypothetical protein MTBLM1_20449 [Rhodospirillaceae bacterium LM-1]